MNTAQHGGAQTGIWICCYGRCMEGRRRERRTSYRSANNNVFVFVNQLKSKELWRSNITEVSLSNSGHRTERNQLSLIFRKCACKTSHSRPKIRGNTVSLVPPCESACSLSLSKRGKQRFGCNWCWESEKIKTYLFKPKCSPSVSVCFSSWALSHFELFMHTWGFIQMCMVALLPPAKKLCLLCCSAGHLMQ